MESGFPSGGHSIVLVPAEEQEHRHRNAEKDAEHHKNGLVVGVAGAVQIIQRHVPDDGRGNGHAHQRQRQHLLQIHAALEAAAHLDALVDHDALQRGAILKCSCKARSTAGNFHMGQPRAAGKGVIAQLLQLCRQIQLRQPRAVSEGLPANPGHAVVEHHLGHIRPVGKHALVNPRHALRDHHSATHA